MHVNAPPDDGAAMNACAARGARRCAAQARARHPAPRIPPRAGLAPRRARHWPRPPARARTATRSAAAAERRQPWAPGRAPALSQCCQCMLQASSPLVRPFNCGATRNGRLQPPSQSPAPALLDLPNLVWPWALTEQLTVRDEPKQLPGKAMRLCGCKYRKQASNTKFALKKVIWEKNSSLLSMRRFICMAQCHTGSLSLLLSARNRKSQQHKLHTSKLQDHHAYVWTSWPLLPWE